MSSSPPETNEDYTVGLVCALPLELAAVEGILDASYGKPKKQDSNDTNTYGLGRIGEHNVVIACLPMGVYGTTSAATVATRMLSSFRSIRFGLMIGIGGGVPGGEHDIRLGDVVVGCPRGTVGGVVQYDLGKAIAGDGFERIGMLNKPPDILLTAISQLEAGHKRNGTIIPQIIAAMVTKNPKMKEGYSYQGKENDQLFQEKCSHNSDDGCESCGSARVEIQRRARNHCDPIIHYGVIASGNQVIKDGAKRDQLSKELNVICFEMEAAGLMDNFPCLVIRGICDYADSHKNKRWQEYAAAVAAAYAKELLSIIPKADVVSIKAALATTQQFVKDAFDRVDGSISRITSDWAHKGIIDWLLPKGYDYKYKNAIEKHTKGTGKWFIDDVERWLQDPESDHIFWCRGIPGAGKTVLTSLTIQYILSQAETQGFSGVAYVYFDQKEQEKQSTRDILAIILGQLAFQIPSIWPSLEELYRQCRNGKEIALVDDLLKMLVGNPTWSNDCRLFLAFDGLDEASSATRNDFLRYINDIASGPRRVFVTSRPNISAAAFSNGVIIKSIEAQDTDLNEFIRAKLEESSSIRQILSSESDDFREDIIRQFVSRANGMFLVAEFLVRLCTDSTCADDILNYTKTMPSDPDGIYERTWSNINKQPEKRAALASRVLSWVCFAKRNLRIGELQEAVAIEIGSSKLNRGKLVPDSLLVDVCNGLILLDDRTNFVRLAHATAQDYLRGKFSSKEQSLQITLSCLTFLSYDNFSRSGYGEFVLLGYCDELRLTDYAFRYFLHHARECREESSLSPPLLRFANNDTLCPQFLPECDEYRSIANKYFNEIPRLVKLEGTNPFVFIMLTRNRDAAGKMLKDILREQPSQTTQETMNPLLLASAFGDEEIVKLLLDEGLDVNTRLQDGRTVLHYAAAVGNEAVLKLLLQKKASPESRDNIGRTPLSWAAYSGKTATVKLLLAENVNANSKDEQFGRSALAWAVAGGAIDTVKELVATESVELEIYDLHGQTPLSMAARLTSFDSYWLFPKRQEVFDVLLTACQKRGIDTTSRGDSALEEFFPSRRSLSSLASNPGARGRILSLPRKCNFCLDLILENTAFYTCYRCLREYFDLCKACILRWDSCFDCSRPQRYNGQIFEFV